MTTYDSTLEWLRIMIPLNLPKWTHLSPDAAGGSNFERYPKGCNLAWSPPGDEGKWIKWKQEMIELQLTTHEWDNQN